MRESQLERWTSRIPASQNTMTAKSSTVKIASLQWAWMNNFKMTSTIFSVLMEIGNPCLCVEVVLIFYLLYSFLCIGQN